MIFLNFEFIIGQSKVNYTPPMIIIFRVPENRGEKKREGKGDRKGKTGSPRRGKKKEEGRRETESPGRASQRMSKTRTQEHDSTYAEGDTGKYDWAGCGHAADIH